VRLVKEHHGWFMQEDHGQAYPLTLAHGHTVDAASGKFAELEAFDRCFNQFTLSTGRHQGDRGPKVEVLQGGEPGV
jgi:hypothetical protein